MAVFVTNLFGLFVLNGVILTILVNWVSNRKDRHINGEARYEYIFGRPFVAIIGGHKMVASLVRDLMNGSKCEYVLIQTQRPPEKVRREIASEVKDEKVLERVIIYAGDRTSWHELSELHLELAREIYIIGEPYIIDGSSHDAINMQTWRLMNENIKIVKEEKIPCHMMFEYQSTFTAFQFTDLKLSDSAAFRFIPFSIYENWAQQVLISREVDDKLYYLPLDGVEGLFFSSHQRVHLIVVGMSKMGVALGIEAAHVAHYPNFNNPHTGRPRTLITFIDRNAEREMIFLMGRFRELFQLARWRFVKAPTDVVRPADGKWDIYDTSKEIAERTNKEFPWHDPIQDRDFRSPYYGGYLGNDFIDVDFEFIEGDVALPSIQKYIADACADNKQSVIEYNRAHGTDLPNDTSKTTVAVCLPVASEAMSAALYFDPSVYKNAQ
ncbi:MAG: hypothetical protein K2K49_01515, partial [Duncaniella sp.]|nr:hypothetical protein [Duncaniella sp.]